MPMDETDRRIVNALQNGFPIVERPYLETAGQLGMTEDELIRRLDRMLSNGILTRFGPLYNIERAGGAFTLAAMSVPAADFERVATIVNALPEVAHNYERDHEFNMWFVLAAETSDRIARALERIERETGYPVLDLPKEREYFIGLKLEA
jgi:DNA-binding Lrp family transcriptional regulator